MPIVKKINDLKKKVENMLENSESYEEIYEINVKLDRLIDEYYRENKKIS